MKWTAQYFVSVLIRELSGKGWGEVSRYSEWAVSFLKHFVSYENIVDGAESLTKISKR